MPAPPPAAPSRFDAVLLDLDGTLVDSLADLRTALNETLAREGLPPAGAAAMRAMVGDGAVALLRRALRASGGDPGRAPALLPAFLAVYEPLAAAGTPLFPGAAAAVRDLRTAGYALAIVTNKPARATGLILDAVGLAPLIDTVVGGDTLPERKPDPAPLREALRRLGVAPGRAVMVGDMHHDIAAARAAGTAAILARYGYGRPEDAEDADAVLDDIGGLRAMIGALPAGRAPVS
ncbi:phosphoglycolate phosphatase [Methylobacterium sp. PvP062]|uniref:Phosphoglycolate phosphatase n=1 Tax=Methylobacterium radiotolerans TaxID=31998 RepID=A0ABV2NGW6_9HYPH|nr:MULTISPECIES: phosphoglycolate phosphatase [Methylobacterium]MCX7335327.1 phosphoglycolate phosphatase [Hyphomicrobiales bacterium]KIU36455.1 phosphoglycolate phosphatase [Methylobacterium radiotolerans]KTR98593.1 phosphoglycolate phosphatase [Methylobacterium radiotolerans]KTS43362.1 phosphoglycolate phosphatase [Methylobacterium radiotolerans]KZB98031.1 Phosphoglycolate phosphatase [Methylobacterium radiotolerans]